MSAHGEGVRFGGEPQPSGRQGGRNPSLTLPLQVFLKTQHSFALVNLKPLLPGHVLICPQKPHKRLTDLSAPELTDLMQAVQRVQRMLARHYFTRAVCEEADLADADHHHYQHGDDAEHDAEPRPPGTPEAGSFNIAIQDGSEAGQTVPHLHVHVIPRIPGATAKTDGPGDEIYEMMAAEDGNVGGALWDRENTDGDRPEPGGGFPHIEDDDRQPRTMEEMEEEAAMFKGVLMAMRMAGEEPQGH